MKRSRKGPKASRKQFRRGAKVHNKNRRAQPLRGGYRL